MDIHVFNRDIEFIGSFDNFTTASLQRNYNGSGAFEIVMPLNNSGFIQTGSILLINGSYCIIDYMGIESSEDGSMTCILKGTCLLGILSNRIVIPPVGKEHEEYNLNAETVIKNYIKSAMVSPVDKNRVYEKFRIEPDLKRGRVIEWKSRYGNLLEEVEDISLNSDIGIKIYIDDDTKEFVFDIYEGRDLSIGNTDLSPVIFSRELDNISSLSYSESKSGYKNTAYMGGQGDGKERIVRVVGDAKGRDRTETFIDSRDLATGLEERGRAKLAETKENKSFDCKIALNDTFIYGKSWDLGDIVTVQDKALNISIDTRVTQVTETYDSNGFDLDAVFGNKEDNLIDKINKIDSGAKSGAAIS